MLHASLGCPVGRAPNGHPYAIPSPPTRTPLQGAALRWGCAACRGTSWRGRSGSKWSFTPTDQSSELGLSLVSWNSSASQSSHGLPGLGAEAGHRPRSGKLPTSCRSDPWVLRPLPARCPSAAMTHPTPSPLQLRCLPLLPPRHPAGLGLAAGGQNHAAAVGAGGSYIRGAGRPAAAAAAAAVALTPAAVVEGPTAQARSWLSGCQLA